MITVGKKTSNWVHNPPEQDMQTERKEDRPEAVMMQPALRQIGTTPCPVCHAKVAVFLAKNKRPFINCGLCSARIFYNGQESMRLLKKDLTPVTAD